MTNTMSPVQNKVYCWPVAIFRTRVFVSWMAESLLLNWSAVESSVLLLIGAIGIANTGSGTLSGVDKVDCLAAKTAGDAAFSKRS